MDPEGTLRAHLRSRGVSDAALNEVIPVLVEHLSILVDEEHGVLSGGMLTPVYAYVNPFRSDPEFPGWADMQAREDAAREAARDYVIVRLTTGWHERGATTRPEETR